MSRVPRIRFKGFEEDWEQRKLLSITTMHARIGWQNLRTTEFLDDGKYLLITGTDFVDGKIDFTRCYYVKQERYNQDRNIQIKNGCLLITKDGTLGKVAYVNGLNKPATLNAGIFNVEIRDENKVDRLYLYQYIKAPFLLEYVNQMATGGTIKHLNQNILVDFMVSMPQIVEQKKIGELFQTLDHLITLHQRKLEKLKIIKKSMFENLFPQNGEKTPKIRFSGFNEDWEQRKLGEVIQERNIRTSDFDRFPIFSLTIESGITPKTERYERGSLVTKTEDLFKVVKPNEFVTNPMNLRFGALGYNTQEYDISVSGYYDVFSIDGNNCSGFWNAYFKTQHVMNIFDNLATGSLVEKKRVKYSTLKKIYLSMPSTIEEKNKVSKFMIFTDHLITLHQSKLDKLQKIKKSMLESMFV